ADVHYRAGTGLDLADLPESDLIREARQIDAVRNETAEGGVGSARQHKEQARRQGQNSQGGEDGERAQPRMEAAQAAARNLLLFLQRATDFGAGERRHGEEKIQRQEQEKVQVGRQDGRRQQFQKRDRGGEEKVAIGARAQDLHHGEEEDEMDSG